MMRTSDEMPAVELVGVTKTFRGTVVVDNLNLAVARGSTLGLIGPNGAGKSTTLRMLMGTLAPSTGQVRVLGGDVIADAARIRPRMGYVPERHDIYPWMSVSEVVVFTSRFYRNWDTAFCRDLMDRFALDGRKKVKHLSKGMLVKLSLLLAVSHRPELLILDEPTSGLDPIIHDDFLEAVLRVVCGRGTTVLYSSHNLEDIRRLADSVCILRAGKMLVHGSVDDLLASTKRIRAVLIDGHLPRWIPEGTVSQKIQRREWQLTVNRVDDSVVNRIRQENPVEAVNVYDLSLGELFRDYILGGAES